MIKSNIFLFISEFFLNVCQIVYTRNKLSHIHPKLGRLAKVSFDLYFIKYIHFFLTNYETNFLLVEDFSYMFKFFRHSLRKVLLETKTS